MPESDHQKDDSGTLAALLALLSLIGMVALISLIALVASRCDGAEITIGWDAHPNAKAQGVTAYRVYRISPAPTVLLGVSDLTHLNILADGGDVVAVASFNGVEGSLSVPLTIPYGLEPPLVPPSPPTPTMAKVHVYQTDLKTRKVLATIYVERKEKDFFQLGIEP